MEVPTYRDLFNPTLRALRQAGGSASINEIVDLVIDDMNLPLEVVDQSHGRGSMSELEYRLGWARTYLKRGGLITNSERGVWVLTAEGQRAPTVNPEQFAREIRQARRQARDAADRREAPDGEEDSFEEGNWEESLIAELLKLPPDAFERLCQRMLRESGFDRVVVTGKSGDGGIDGHGIVRMGGLISIPVFFQCKRFKGSVPPSAVRDFRGAMVGRGDKGLLITTGSFTKAAKDEATREGAPIIDLMDGTQLAERLKELRLGVSVETVSVEQVTIKPEMF